MVDVAKMAPPSIMIALSTTDDSAKKSKKLAELVRHFDQTIEALYKAAKTGLQAFINDRKNV